VANLAGCSNILTIDKVQHRLDISTGLGTYVNAIPLNDANVDSIERLLSLPIDLAFDCAGAPDSLQLAADVIKRHGTIILVGLSSIPVTINAKEWSRKELNLKVAMAYTDEFGLALNLIRNRKIQTDKIISHTVKLEDLDFVLQDMKHKDMYIKVLLQI